VLPDFQDITSRIAEEPSWHDEHGTPRYGEFHPRDLGVYDDSALLVEIRCQACGQRFLVGQGFSSFDRIDSALRAAYFDTGHKEPEILSPEDFLRRRAEFFHYGDPPRHGSCSGNTMNCVDHRIVQAWLQDKKWPGAGHDERWLRWPEIEGDLELPDWAR
jgi:hypothetical protein